MTAAVQRVIEEKGVDVSLSVAKCSGADECRKALMLLKAGKLPDDFVEGMACAGGCLAGPATLYELQKSKKVFEARMDAAPDNIRDNVAEKGCAADVHRHV